MDIGSAKLQNTSDLPNAPTLGNLRDIVESSADSAFYLTPAGCKGILRRRAERGLTINKRLELVLTRISSEWTDEQIDKVSRIQPRGRFSAQTNSNSIFARDIDELVQRDLLVD